jgi:hypothetical protein
MSEQEIYSRNEDDPDVVNMQQTYYLTTNDDCYYLEHNKNKQNIDKFAGKK